MRVVCLQGATVVDFAYHVHTDVGNHMKAAKVNGKPVHSDYALKNAEVRSPVPRPQRCTSKGDVPSIGAVLMWMHVVCFTRSRSHAPAAGLHSPAHM